MKYLLFGTGDCYNRFRCWFEKDEISALIDNSNEKQGNILDGIEIVSPEVGIKKQYDIIIILSFYYESMKKQLLNLGVPDNKIYHFYDLHKFKNVDYNSHPIRTYSLDEQKSCKKILLLNQNLSIGGPALTLLDSARILKKNGYQVVYGSMIDGPLKDVLLSEEISAIIDENLLIATMNDINWIQGYDLILCNAINFYYFLSKRDTLIPCIWWLHDSEFFYEGVDKEIIADISDENLKTVAVGKVASNTLTHYAPQLQPEYLLYGTRDYTSDVIIKDCHDDKLIFMTVGFVESRKGQDVLVEAITMLPLDIRTRCRFYIVGKNTSAMAQDLMEKASYISEIIFTGMVKDVHEYMVNSDVLICPSREDPMPAACTEAMMHGIPCIVSDIAGTAEYITPEENGWVFQSENADDLADKIVWCAKNKEKLVEMGNAARKVYEKHFEMGIFEKKLLKIVDDCLK